MPDSSYPYSSIENGWVRDISNLPAAPLGLTNEVIIKNKFSGKYSDNTGPYANTETHNATLISHSITKNGPEYHAPRVYYPHTVLKHTFYMHCDNQITSPVVDSFSFVLDHTRGTMRKYPFTISNSIESQAAEHDIPIKVSWATDLVSLTLNSFDHFPKPLGIPFCNFHFGDDISWNNEDYIRPLPGTLLEFFIGNAGGTAAVGYSSPGIQQGGIQQQYKIDRVINLNIINPEEKVIYNPSEVEIDLDQSYNSTPESKILIFPSGYTFKTVQGKYPSLTDLAFLDPNNMYYHKQNIPYTNLTCDDVGPNDGIFSYYYIKSGSTLIIEPCVSIYDAKIIVEAGGTLLYDKNLVKGNFTLQNNGGIVDLNYSYPYLNSNIPSTCSCDCYIVTEYDATNIDITGNQTWSDNYLPFDTNGDGVVKISGTLFIHSNAKLTINGSVKFEFGENGKIIVDRKGKLIVNGGTLPIEFTTNVNCEKGMWSGIEVWGNTSSPSQSLLSSDQGYIHIVNAKISNARNAIITNNSNDGTNQYHGGIVECINTNFINNYRDVEFFPYKHISTNGNEIQNLSSFTNCHFIINNKFNDSKIISADGRSLAGYERVKLTDVKNVRFNRCLFENSAMDPLTGKPLFDVDLRGTGIYGLDAAINISGVGTNKTIFKGLTNGIWMVNTGAGVDYVSVSGVDFINNVHGLTLEGNKHSKIVNNHFEIPSHEIGGQKTTSGYNKPVGLYLIGTSEFSVIENSFTNYGVVTSNNQSINEYNYGMIVNNCVGYTYDSYGVAYMNSFENVNINLQTELDNRGIVDNTILTNTQIYPGTGFGFKCNTFNSRINYDVTVVSKDQIEGKIREQGLCNDPFNPANSAQVQAGNAFTACTSGSVEQMNFDLMSEQLDFNEGQLFRYRDQPGKLQCSNLISQFNACNPSLGLNSCPSNTCTTFPCSINAYNSAAINFTQLVTNFNLLLDGGNSNFLLNSINGSMSAGQLKNLLLSKSPYLSDTVLISVLRRTNPLPPGHIKQIAIANSPLTKRVLNVVEELNLPIGIRNDIFDAQAGISARKEKESEIDYYAFEKNITELSLKQMYLEVDNLDSLKKIAQKDTTLNGLFKLMEVLIENGDLSEAQICRTKIINKEIPHISDRCKFLSIRLNLALQGKTWFDLSPSQYATIKQIYLNNPETAIYARAVLTMVKGIKYEKYPYDIITNRNSLSIPAENVLSDIIQSQLKIYPNPAADNVIVEVDLNEKIQNSELVIYNMLGVEVKRNNIHNLPVWTLNVAEFDNGVYLLVLKGNNGIVEKKKFVISR